jgi:hypothetical protein
MVPKAISRRIVITAYDGISLLDLAGPLEAFRVASTFGGPSPSDGPNPFTRATKLSIGLRANRIFS